MAYAPVQASYPVGMAPQPAVTIVQRPVINPLDKKGKYKRHLYGFGITEIVLGCSACLLCVISIIIAANGYRYSYYGGITYVAAGIWCGGFLIVSGILGILTLKRPTVCMYNANMVMTIIGAVMMTVMFGISVPAAIISYRNSGLISIHVLQSVISFAGFIITIVHSAYCCAGACGGCSYQGQVVNPVQGQQFVQLANGQYMLVQGKPLMSQPMTSIPSTGAPVTVPLQPAPTFHTITSTGYAPAQVAQAEPTKQPGGPVDSAPDTGAGVSQPPSYEGHNFQ